MSLGGQGTVPDRPLELMRQAVIRDGYRCSICGRPCSENEARRHSEASAFGDSSMNFAAMCYGCQTWLAHEGAKPAQYITHIYDRSKARLQLCSIMDNCHATLVVGVYMAYAILSGIVIYYTPYNVFTVLTSCVLTFYLLHLGLSFLDGFREGQRGRDSGQRVHRTFDQPTIRLDNQR
jgi:hypothetical protein